MDRPGTPRLETRPCWTSRAEPEALAYDRASLPITGFNPDSTRKQGATK
ncbi:MAG: hypothetical protein AVDCRST_MAG87-709 [uncultured Thermomicrobiales bacterium]|uniref:Uncharacterized protein n=1 Tax=uncultured Thermomicrobiales bacterium TaxID=1645740 RepID=A0A6J4UFJ0_9BACT|nr:MAG: hypothetical protein AVDCRST_MAG87-709 [uncultured Thermomicrobiales bacterium]